MFYNMRTQDCYARVEIVFLSGTIDLVANFLHGLLIQYFQDPLTSNFFL